MSFDNVPFIVSDWVQVQTPTVQSGISPTIQKVFQRGSQRILLTVFSKKAESVQWQQKSNIVRVADGGFKIEIAVA